MNFTNPWLFAAGVACLAIPVWVHFQHRRQPRRVVFSTNRFIEPSEEETRLGERLRKSLTRMRAVRALQKAVEQREQAAREALNEEQSSEDQ